MLKDAYNSPMDERKTNIKELEDKKRVLTENRNRLIMDLGEALIVRIGEEEPFQPGDNPSDVLAEYRKLQKEIAESVDGIKSLEADIVRLKELEEIISTREEEQTLLTAEQEQVDVRLGMALFKAHDLKELSDFKKQQEEGLLAKIDEHEKNLEDLEEQKVGIFSWLGKNAKIAVEKALLAKSRSDLQKLYRSTGEEFSSKQIEIPEGEAGEIAGKAFDLHKQLASLTETLSSLKGERRKIGGVFGSESSPSRRIQGLEKQITLKKKEIPIIYLKFGSLVIANDGKETFSSLLNEGDYEILQETGKIASQIDEAELGIKKIRAAIDIDSEKAEIGKIEKAILEQRRRINAAEDAISGYEKQIAESEQHIEELKAFIQDDHGSTN